MFRVLILSGAALAVFIGIATVVPVLEEYEVGSATQVAIASAGVLAIQERPPGASTPSCVVSVYPNIVSSGQEVSIAWRSDNISAAALSGVGIVPLRGGMFLSPTRSSVFMLSVRNSSGEFSSCTAHVTVL